MKEGTATPEDRRIGPLLRQARLALLMTLEELADASGVSIRAISDLERGLTRRPYPRTVRLLTEALGLPDAAGDELVAMSRALAKLDGTTRPASTAGPGDTPAQLPAGVRHFTGRKAELAMLDTWLDEAGGHDGPAAITAVCGAAGVGKTTLALRWAHQASPRFPDGQLYVNLRGFGPAQQPADPAEAIRGFLDAFGVPEGRIPGSIEAQAALCRSVLADRRVLMMLDNASDEDQVRPLLPAGPGCAVIVTSRRQLAGLAAIEGARVLTMDVLAGPEACELLAARLGTQRAKAEPEAVAELAELCGRLPLALGIIAARVATGPPVPLARHATELRGSRGRLDALDAGGATADVRTVFSWSDQRLSGGAARMFRLLGLHPGPDIGLPAAASLAALTRRQCRVTLAELIRASLISEHSPGRFAVHDLLHAYAAELADAMPEAERQAAIRRMLDHYLHSSVTAALLLFQIDPPGRPPPPEPGTAPERPADRGEAYAWFDGERPVLLALIHQAGLRGYHAHAWWLASALREFFLRRARWQDLITTQQIALAAADKLGDPGKRAAAHRYLGATLSRMDRYQESQYQLRLAMELYRGLGDQLGEARIEFQLCLIPYRQGEWSEALAHARRSRLLALACGRPADEAYALSTAGWCYGLLGQTRLALAYCERALRLHRQVGSGLGESLTLQILGCVRLRTGDHRGAVTLLRQAADVCRTTGDRYHLADMLDDLGDAHLAAGNRESARDCWRQALATFEDLGLQPRAAQARAKLAASA